MKYEREKGGPMSHQSCWYVWQDAALAQSCLHQPVSPSVSVFLYLSPGRWSVLPGRHSRVPWGSLFVCIVSTAKPNSHEHSVSIHLYSSAGRGKKNCINQSGPLMCFIYIMPTQLCKQEKTGVHFDRRCLQGFFSTVQRTEFASQCEQSKWKIHP